MERECIGKQVCEISVTEEVFRGNPCPDIYPGPQHAKESDKWHLLVEYVCNKHTRYQIKMCTTVLLSVIVDCAVEMFSFNFFLIISHTFCCTEVVN